MDRVLWKFLTSIFLIIFIHSFYDVVKLFLLGLLDTPIWLNALNFMASIMLLIGLVCYSFRLHFLNANMCYFIITFNMFMLIITAFIEFRLGGYNGQDKLFIMLVNMILALVVFIPIYKHAKRKT